MLRISLIKEQLQLGIERIVNGRLWRHAACVLVALVSMPSRADYNANLIGNVTQILTYNSGAVLFMLDNQPAANGACNAVFFEVDPGNTAGDAAFNRMYARLLEAYSLGQTVHIGFDNAANCGVMGYITVYRIG